VFITLRILLSKKTLSVKQFFIIYSLSLIGLGFVYLAGTGRLHWLFALFGGIMPFLAGMARGGLNIFRTVSLFRNVSGFFDQFTGSGGPSAGQSSDITTRFLKMSLDHDSGDLDGEVLIGQFEGRRLSDLDLSLLMALLGECRPDQDSVNVLIAYMDRSHPDWREQEGEGADRQENNFEAMDNIDENQALAILGLDNDATKDEIVAAHRRLIQKMHPDRGGSTFLAARINEAKTLLMQLRDKDD